MRPRTRMPPSSPFSRIHVAFCRCSYALLLAQLHCQSEALLRDLRPQASQILLLFDGADQAEPDERRVGEPPDALWALRIAPVPLRARVPARGAAQPRRFIIPRSAPRDVGVPPLVWQQHRSNGSGREPPVRAVIIAIQAPLRDVAV